MKVLLVNGSPHKNGSTNRALEEMKKTFILPSDHLVLLYDQYLKNSFMPFLAILKIGPSSFFFTFSSSSRIRMC